MQMKMFVGVDMIKRQPACRKCFELGADLGSQLSPDPGEKEKPHAVTGHPVAKTTFCVDQIRDGSVRQNRVTVGKHQMQADAQTRKSTSSRNRVGSRRSSNHQTGGT